MGTLWDRLATSEAWRRLQQPSEPGTDPAISRVKHDMMQVLQTVIASADEALEHAVDADATVEKLQRDLYDPKNGDFANQRSYTDGKFARWSMWLTTVAGGAIVAAFAYLLNRGGS